ncbi:MAG: GNAT family N-acetyltransferase [Bacteriovoracaceae bacterium]|nr:GNAT family N-acetyltransferase [Bacteriovoracaceae bacterium]
MLIRDMRLEDADQVANIHVKAWQKVYKGIMPQDFLDSLDVFQRAERWRGGFEKDPTLIRLVAEKNDHILGFAVGLENRHLNLVPEAKSEVWAIYVHPEFWGHGIGGSMLEEFKKRVEIPMCIWVASENKLAHGFYQKMGGVLLPVERDEEIAGVKIPHQVYLFE